MFKLNLKKMGKFPKMPGKDLLGIEFGNNNLKFVHLRSTAGGFELVNVCSKNIIGLAEDDTSRLIGSTLSELHVGLSEVINIIPAHLAITKNIEIPSTNPNEIKDIIELQAGRHTPYAREEIIVGFVNIGVHKFNYTKILLVIIARSNIKRELDILEKTGIRLEKIFFSCEGMGWCFSKLTKLESGGVPLAALNIDERFSEFTIIQGAKPIFVRTIPIGAQNLNSEKEKFEPRLAEEVKKSLEAYYSEDIEKKPTTLAVCGATSGLSYLTTTLESNVNLVVKFVSVQDLKGVSVSVESNKALQEAKNLSFFGVICGIIAHKDVTINLVPEEIKLKKQVAEKGKELIKTGILLLACFVLIFSIFVSEIYFKNSYLGKLKKKYEELASQTKDFDESFNKILLVKNYISNRGLPLEIVGELFKVIPEELRLNEIKLDDQGKMGLKGTASSMSRVFAFVDNLEKSEYFKEVKTKYTSKRKEEGKDVADFDISCVVEKKGNI